MDTYPRQKNPFLDRRPYVYAIMWTNLNMAYIGVRYATSCHPNELWKKYFTSSNYVSQFRADHGEPDHIEIIDVFLTATEAIDAEHDILSSFALHISPVFLNKNAGGAIVMDDDVKAKVSAAAKGRVPWNKGKKCKGTPATWLQGKPAHNRGKKHTPDAYAKMTAKHRIHEYDGKLYTKGELTKLSGLSRDGFERRLRAGMTIKEAVETDSSALRTAANHRKFADPVIRAKLRKPTNPDIA
jgi:hypothetical protein